MSLLTEDQSLICSKGIKLAFASAEQFKELKRVKVFAFDIISKRYTYTIAS